MKFTPQNVVATGTTPGGQVVFLETGSSSAGLQHIIEEHGAEFANMGVSPAQIPEVVMQAVSDLHVSLHLLTQLEEWNREFQRTFSDDYPPDSGFTSEDDRNRHNARGAELAALLQQELGAGVRIEFKPLK